MKSVLVHLLMKSAVGTAVRIAALGLGGAFLTVAAAETPETPEPLRIGTVNAQSGPSAGLGRGMLQGITAVFAEVNREGGIAGRALELLTADDRYEPDLTAQETLKLVQQERVIALLGYVGTPTTNAALPLARDLGVPLVAPFTGAMSLRVPVSAELFHLRASYDDETEALVERLLAGGAKSIAVAYQHDGFGMSVLSGVEKALQRRGLALAAKGSFVRNSQNVAAAIDTLVRAKPDAVVIAAPYNAATLLIRGLRSDGSARALATVSFVGTEDLLATLGGAGEGLLISQVVPPLTDGPLGGATRIERQCRRLLAKHVKVPLGYVNFEGCIGAMVLVEALRRTSAPHTAAAVMAALDRLQLPDFGGLDIDFTQGRRQAMAQVFMTQVRDGQAVPVGADAHEPDDGRLKLPAIRAQIDGSTARPPAH